MPVDFTMLTGIISTTKSNLHPSCLNETKTFRIAPSGGLVYEWLPNCERISVLALVLIFFALAYTPTALFLKLWTLHQQKSPLFRSRVLTVALATLAAITALTLFIHHEFTTP